MLAQLGVVLLDLSHAVRSILVVGVRRLEERTPRLLQARDGLDDVVGRERDVLHAGAAVELEVLLDLALALALGRLVDRELDLPVAVRQTFDMSAEYSVWIWSSSKWRMFVNPKTRS